MAYDIRLMKLVTGEMVIGKYDAEKDCLNEVASLQSIPTQQGMQMMTQVASQIGSTVAQLPQQLGQMVTQPNTPGSHTFDAEPVFSQSCPL